MKKLIAILLTLGMVLCFVGCNEIVTEKPIDVEYIAAYDAMETVYGYKYDWWNGEVKYLPEYKMVHHEEQYKIQYERVWSDGTTDTYWLDATKTEYEKALQEIENVGAENDNS